MLLCSLGLNFNLIKLQVLTFLSLHPHHLKSSNPLLFSTNSLFTVFNLFTTFFHSELFISSNSIMIFTTSLCLLALTHLTQASLSPTFPVSGSTCAVSTDCQIKWQDTPASPSTASMGETAIDLVTGDPNNLQIAQRLGGVSNPGTALAMTFKPDPSLSSTAR